MSTHQKKRIHIIGIKGWGTSALAQLLAAQGNSVCGSDVPTYYRTQDLLSNKGIGVEEFCDHLHDDIDEVVYSTAYINHPEFQDALSKGIPTLSYPQRLAPLFNESYGIAVSGTHGKTTTTGWIAYVFRELGYDPCALIGSRVKQFSTNVLVGTSPYFILEADEYQRKLDMYDPSIAIITSIEYDHPDFFKKSKDYVDVFQKFAERVLKSGIVIACWEPQGVRDALGFLASPNLITYGFDPALDYCARNITTSAVGHTFDVVFRKKLLGSCSIKLFGTHNVLNALAVIATCHTLAKGQHQRLFNAVHGFEGTARRYEMRNPIGTTIVIDDYAHHPTEIRVTLQALRNQYPNKQILCVFFPHTYSRTEKLFKDFITCFDSVDEVALIDIYGSVREQSGTVTSRQLVDAINARGLGRVIAHATGSCAQTGEFIKGHIHAFDVLVTMGAEDIWKEWDSLLGPVTSNQ